MKNNIFTDTLQRGCERLNITLSDHQISQFCQYKELLLEWNEKINLTAITDPFEMADKHFCDSLSLLSQIDLLSPGAKMIDIGTGAGFPSIPLLIMCPYLQLTLLDSLNKRLQFLDHLLSRLGLSATFVHERAEDAGHQSEFREKFDLVTARALSSLPSLCEYCLPFVKIGGLFVAMKGPALSEELDSAQYAIQTLGGTQREIFYYTLLDNSQRSLIFIEKNSHTPPQYARKTKKISKSPL